MICVPDGLTVTYAEGIVPKSTAVVPLKPVPAIVTAVPCAVDPSLGLTPVTTGGARAKAVRLLLSPSTWNSTSCTPAGIEDGEMP